MELDKMSLINFKLSSIEISALCEFSDSDYYILHTVKPFVGNNLFILAFSDDFPIGFNEMGIFLYEDGEKRFVNSSIENFSNSILEFDRYRKEIQKYVDADEEEQIQVVNFYIENLKEIDAVAWAEANNFWPIIANQMLEGNL